jgi:hypothetical protein
MSQQLLDKSTLQAEELLTHSFLGTVIYTKECQELDARMGTPLSLYVYGEVEDEVKEVSLVLVQRKKKLYKVEKSIK